MTVIWSCKMSMLTNNIDIKSSVFRQTHANLPAVVNDNSHGCGRRQSGQV